MSRDPVALLGELQAELESVGRALDAVDRGHPEGTRRLAELGSRCDALLAQLPDAMVESSALLRRWRRSGRVDPIADWTRASTLRAVAARWRG